MHRNTSSGPPKPANSLNKSTSDNNSSVYRNAGSGANRQSSSTNQRERSMSNGGDSSHHYPNPSGIIRQGNNDSVVPDVPATVAPKPMNPAARYLASRRDKNTGTSDPTHSNKALGGVVSQKDSGFVVKSNQVENVLDSSKMGGEGEGPKNSVNLNKSFGGFNYQQGDSAGDGDKRSSKNLNKSFGGFDANGEKINTRYQQRLNRKLKKQQQKASNPDVSQDVIQKVPEASVTAPSTVGVSSKDVPKTAVHNPSGESQENGNSLNKFSDPSHLGDQTDTQQMSHDASTKGPINMNKSFGGIMLQGNNGSVFTEVPSTVPPKSMNSAARYLASRHDENTTQGTSNSTDSNKSLCGTKPNSQHQACQDGKGQGPKTPTKLNKTFGGFNDQNGNSNISKDRGSKSSKNLNKSFGGYAANGENVSSKQQQQEVIQKEVPVPESSVTSMAAFTDSGSFEDVSKTVAEDVPVNLNWTLPAGNLHEAFKEEEDVYFNQTINCSIASSQFIRTQPSAVKVFAYYEKQREKNGEKLNKKLWDLIEGGNEMTILLDKMKAKNGKLTKTEIKQLVLDDSTSLRLCILSEAVEKKSIVESFSNITKIIGTQDIDYHDFKFWFERFSSGNWDLNQKTISDMPVEILAVITEKLDFLTKMQLRNVSRGLRNIVEEVRLSIDTIYCNFYEESDNSKRSSSIWVCNFDFDNMEFAASKEYDEDDVEKTLNDLKILLKSRHLRLWNFEWHNNVSSAINEQLINMLSSLSHKVEIDSLETNANGDTLVGLLSAIKPATLKNISTEHKLGPIDIERLAQLEQWKKAKFVCFPSDVSEFSCSYHYFLHFKSMRVIADSLSIDDILSIKKLFLQSNMLNRFNFDSKNIPSMEDVEDALGPSDISVDEDHDWFSYFEEGMYRIYSIPGSNDILEIHFSEYGAVFERKNSESD